MIHAQISSAHERHMQYNSALVTCVQYMIYIGWYIEIDTSPDRSHKTAQIIEKQHVHIRACACSLIYRKVDYLTAFVNPL